MANESAPQKRAATPWIIALTVTLATFMEVLDTSIANVSLPHIAGNLSASLNESTWVLTSYLVANAIILPLSGWLSSLMGRKNFYMTCVALFTVASALSGLAPSLGWLVFFRVLQGLSGGGLQPSEQAILADTFPPEQFGMAMAIYGMAVVCAPILGPTLGGWITDNFSWRWIFFINIPVGIASLIMTSRLVQDPPTLKRLDLSKGFKFDYIGLSLIALGLASLQIVLDKGQEADWFGANYIIVLSVVAVLALVGTVIWELKTESPVVDLRLLGERNFAVAILFMIILGAVFNGSTVLLPQFLQSLMGYTATAAGFAMSPGGLALLVMMPVAGALSSRIQPRWLIAAGFTFVSLSMWLSSGLTLGINMRYIIMTRLVFSLGGPLLFIPINVAAYAFVPKGKNNAASGLINLARNMGASIGIAGLGTVIERRTQYHQVVLVGHMTPYDRGFSAALASAQSFGLKGTSALALVYATVQQQAALLAYVDGFQIMMTGALLAIPLVLLLKNVTRGKGSVPVH
jgi:DHA2 family multidrug resistance protein